MAQKNEKSKIPLKTYQTLIEFFPACVKLVDENGRLISINRYSKYEHFLENKTQAFIENWDYFSSVKPEYHSSIKRAIKLASKGKLTNLAFEHRPGFTRNQFCLGIFMPVQEQSKKAKNILFISTDITEKKLAEQKERELSEYRYKIISIISHQFRTPLNDIRWEAERILSGDLGNITESLRESISNIYSQNVTVINRLYDMLTILDVLEGKTKLVKKRISLDSILAPITSQWEKKCTSKNINFIYKKYVKTPVFMEVDKQRILPAINQIFGNAYDYTFEGGTIIFKVFKRDKYIHFEIKDTGIGIPRDEQAKVFTMFFRATNAVIAKSNASGIGLAIAKHFIERHGGRIDFKSKKNYGSTFWFVLPIK